jgi:prepilin-type N-terminal cleavage/methylation domain-containing protein
MKNRVGGEHESKPLGNRGFTFIELCVAILIFCLGFMAIVKMQKAAIRANAYTLQESEALNVMKSTTETLMGFDRKATAFGGTDTLTATWTTSAPSVETKDKIYHPSWSVSQVNGMDLKQVTLKVTWTDLGTDHKVAVTFYK